MYTAPDGHTYRVADAHTHVYAESIARRATENMSDFYAFEAATKNPTTTTLIEEGSRVGVDRYLVCSVATKPMQVDTINLFIAKECGEHPEFIGMATSHPEVEDVDLLLDVVDIMGLHGIKLHPDLQQFNIDDPRMFPLYREAAERNVALMFHVGDERYDYSNPVRMARALDEVPNMICHAAHFGCCRVWKRRPLALKDYDIMYDTSSALAWMSVEEALDLVDQLGVDRLMWGTDFPLWKHQDELDRFFALGLSPEDNQKILYDNFARFYGLND